MASRKRLFKSGILKVVSLSPYIFDRRPP